MRLYNDPAPFISIFNQLVFILSQISLLRLRKNALIQIRRRFQTSDRMKAIILHTFFYHINHKTPSEETYYVTHVAEWHKRWSHRNYRHNPFLLSKN